jgi:hypothetical protein
VACLVAAQFLPAFADYPKEVHGPADLAKFALELQNSGDRGPHSINFNYYGNVGTFKVDGPTDKVESLTFQRLHSDSEAVIKVSTTFLDIKKMPGKVILKGLAFQLLPNAVLIAGADGSKINGSLLIDSCFIFADTLDNTFLSWWGDNLGSVEIRNSYIVIGGSKTSAARMALTAGSVKLNNNLINFSGAVSATGVTKQAQFLSNTVNRTQFELTGKLDAGQYPSLEFTKNLFAHRGPKDAFGGPTVFVVNYGLFDIDRVFIGSNKMYNTWNGFDYPANAKFALGSNNSQIDTIPGKAANEKWNWYTESLDNNQTGLLSGAIRLEKYNVLPPDSTFAWALPRGMLSVAFQPAPYPRLIALDTFSTRLALPSDSAFHRRIFPSAGYAHFGPFRIDRITLGATAEFGKPVLIAMDSTDTLRTQASAALVKANPSIYANGLGMARKFILVNAGNTPMGANIRPGESSLVGANDKLQFSVVDSAGNSVVKAPAAQDLPKDLRSLEASIQVQTTAVINSNIQVGTAANVTPYSPDKVFWLFRNPADTLVPAVKELTMPDAGKYTATARYSSAKGNIDAYLVEKLSIPAGGKSIPVSDGTVRVYSPQGFQLKVDSAYVPDSLVYGVRSKGYAFTWPFKSSTDSVILILTKKPEQELFVKVGNSSPDTLKGRLDSAGNFKIVVAQVDTGKVFFAGVPYNVVKGSPYTKAFSDGVNLTDFISSTSGKLQYDSTLAPDIRESLNSVVKEFRYLGGRQMRAISVSSINPSAPYGMSFVTRGPQNASKVEVYVHNGIAWSLTPLSGNYSGNTIGVQQVPINARAFAVVERLESADTYVESVPQVSGTTLTVAPRYLIDSLKHITHYCVELLSVNTAGIVDSQLCADKDKKEIALPTTRTLENSAYQIRIRFYMGPDPIDGRNFEPLKDYGYNLEKIVAATEDVAVKKPKRWSIVGFPISGKLSEILEKQKLEVALRDSSFDTTFVVRFHKDSLGAVRKGPFDSLKTWSTLQVTPGKAFLMASTHTFKTVIRMTDTALKLEPYTLTLDTGWNFISNPFPTTMLASKIRSSLNREGLVFYGLDVRELGSDRRSYGWKAEAALRAFFGYAFYAQPNEKLIFNQLADTARSPAKIGASLASAPDLEARLESPWGASAMTFTSLPRRMSIPYLPSPVSGPQLRIGGGAGYMIKAVARADQIDEPMEIRSAAAGPVSFTMSRPFQAGLIMRLIDLETGRVYDEAGARNLSVSEGSQRYQLLAGDAAFVESRTRAFLAAAPAEIGLSQNFPNPFRGRTNVELRWPAWEGGARTAVLQVMDMQGRLCERIDLGEIRVGRQVVTLDASEWQSGVYLYRLEVAAGDRRIHLQKRMLVTP